MAIITITKSQNHISFDKPSFTDEEFSIFRSLMRTTRASHDARSISVPEESWNQMEQGLKELGVYVADKKSPENQVQEKYSVYDDLVPTPTEDGLTRYWRDLAEGFIAAAEDRAKIFKRMGNEEAAKSSLESARVVQQRISEGKLGKK